MSVSPNPVEQAASFLKNSSATPKEKLFVGGKLLRAAMFSKDWTPELLDRATTAYKPLLKCDSIKKTVERMDEKAASRCLAQFTKDVTQLATDIEQAKNQQP